MKKLLLSVCIIGLIFLSTGCSTDSTLKGRWNAIYEGDSALNFEVNIYDYVEFDGNGKYSHTVNGYYKQKDCIYELIDDDAIKLKDEDGETWTKCKLVKEDRLECSDKLVFLKDELAD